MVQLDQEAYSADTLADDEWLTVKGAAAYLKVSVVTIYRMCEEGLRYGMLRGHRRFRKADLDAQIKPVQPKPRRRRS